MLTTSLELEPIENAYTVGDDIGKLLKIENIYFDFNKHNIRYDAEIELQKVLEVLNTNPNMKISIRSHTDCRGRSSYNKDLSQRRAMATMNYLIAKGIAQNRLTAKGYGESRLIEHCECTSCTKEQHQANRRSEFIITEL